MEDEKIVQLYWDRNELAIAASSDKYGGYCMSIANNILGNHEDAEECVSAAYMKAWDSIPPNRPGNLAAFLGKLTRNISINRYNKNTAEKRGGGELPAVLDELAELLSGNDVEQEFDRKELINAIDAFLLTLSSRKRSIFVCRYWYTNSVRDIAASHGMRESAVSMTLNRLRSNLRSYLLERGFDL